MILCLISCTFWAQPGNHFFDQVELIVSFSKLFSIFLFCLIHGLNCIWAFCWVIELLREERLYHSGNQKYYLTRCNLEKMHLRNKDVMNLKTRLINSLQSKNLFSLWSKCSLWSLFYFAMTHFLKIDVNVFVINRNFYQWISGANYAENKRF